MELGLLLVMVVLLRVSQVVRHFGETAHCEDVCPSEAGFYDVYVDGVEHVILLMV